MLFSFLQDSNAAILRPPSLFLLMNTSVLPLCGGCARTTRTFFPVRVHLEGSDCVPRLSTSTLTPPSLHRCEALTGSGWGVMVEGTFGEVNPSFELVVLWLLVLAAHGCYWLSLKVEVEFRRFWNWGKPKVKVSHTLKNVWCSLTWRCLVELMRSSGKLEITCYELSRIHAFFYHYQAPLYRLQRIFHFEAIGELSWPPFRWFIWVLAVGTVCDTFTEGHQWRWYLIMGPAYELRLVY